MFGFTCSHQEHAKIGQGFCPVCNLLLENGDVVSGVIKMGPIRVEFQPIPDSFSMSSLVGEAFHSAGASYRDSSVIIHLRDGSLTVNDRDFGTMVEGDRLLIENGKVFVNGEERM